MANNGYIEWALPWNGDFSQDDTGDIVLTFENHTLLEILNTSSGYEAWQFDDGKGWGAVATGGGEVSIWRD